LGFAMHDLLLGLGRTWQRFDTLQRCSVLLAMLCFFLRS
uniref:Uncharacterized protein n=1 Tax=Aegilops tauschii subsp. strangulata TaxID=200361 RepID=A0A453CI60_AEGTS